MRCVVCGRLPAEPCHLGVHKAHRRMWEALAVPGVGRNTTEALEILARLDHPGRATPRRNPDALRRFSQRDAHDFGNPA